jgi:aspartokinase/homoserine dehydrogenase 1
MQVLKFGGTSVAHPDKIVDIVRAALERDRTILVCSAISGCTDTLIRLGGLAAAREESYLTELEALYQRHAVLMEGLLPADRLPAVRETVDALFDSLKGILHGVFLLGELSPTSLDAVQSYGELFSTKILSAKFTSLGIPCRWLDARDLVKTCDGVVDTALTYALVAAAINSQPHTSLFIVPGFIASDRQGRVSTLGRGGSDYTASLFAVAVNARLVEIWTDVPGIMTANPKTVPTARTVRNISYRAAQELSHFGAKVIFPPTIQPVINEGIPIYVKDTFDPGNPGTLVEKNPPRHEGALLGIANSDKIALISLEGSGMVGIPGFSSRLFDALTRAGINIILITQASSVHTMCIAIAEHDAPAAKQAADSCFAYEISLGKLQPLKVETGYSIVCLVGDDILGHSGATGRMLAALGARGIPVRATAQGSSERNISVIVASDKADEAIRAIHGECFDRSPLQTVPLFIAGYGTVGKALVKMIGENHDAIARRTGKDLRICGLANSRRYLIDTEGVDPASLGDGCTGSFFEALADLSLEGAIFVDCTASEETGLRYPQLFKAGYSVVACNKIPFSGSYESYAALKAAAAREHAGLRHETTVGAALPILATLERMAVSGDTLVSVEAVLSGTLNYLCDNYLGHDFAALVEDARQKGYTEPDPAVDLSGRDVLRKTLILARVAGFPLEETEVQLEPFPAEEQLATAFADATADGRRLRYVARLDAEGHARVGLQAVGPDSPLFTLTGTDNCAVITSTDYPSPQVIRGAGAGPRQTAAGLLSDILSTV